MLNSPPEKRSMSLNRDTALKQLTDANGELIGARHHEVQNPFIQITQTDEQEELNNLLTENKDPETDTVIVGIMYRESKEVKP